MCPPALYCCVRLCLAILYIYLPALDVASSSFDFEKHKLFGVYGGVICLPGWVLVVGFPAGLSRTFLSFVSYFFSFVSFPFICLSPRLGACGRVPACLPRPFPVLFICLPVLFIVSQAGCLWSRVCGWLVSHVVSFVIFVSHFFSLSIHLSSRSVAGGVRPFPMSMQHVYSFVSQL